MKMNPILKKELRIGSRSFKLPLALMVYNFILAGITLIALFSLQMAAMSSGYEYGTLIILFPVLAGVQCGMITLIIPILTAASVSGERERQTLDVMLTSPIKPFQIATGKLTTAMVQVLMFIVSSIPIMSVAFVLGGMNWFNLLAFLIMMVYISIYIGSIGVYCSSMVKKTIASVILTFVMIAAVIIVVNMIYGMLMGAIGFMYVLYHEIMNGGYTYMADYSSLFAPLILIFNPYMAFVDFIMRATFATSLADATEFFMDPWLPVKWIMQLWIPISFVVNMFIAFLFLRGAAKHINPVSGRKRRKNKKKNVKVETKVIDHDISTEE